MDIRDLISERTKKSASTSLHVASSRGNTPRQTHFQFFFWAKHEAYYIHSFYRNCYATEEREMKPFFDCESNMTTTIKYAWLVASIV